MASLQDIATQLGSDPCHACGTLGPFDVRAERAPTGEPYVAVFCSACGSHTVYQNSGGPLTVGNITTYVLDDKVINIIPTGEWPPHHLDDAD